MQFKNYSDIYNYFNSVLETDFYIEAIIDKVSYVYNIKRYFNTNRDDSDKTSYTYNSITLADSEVISKHIAGCHKLFINGAESVRVISEREAILKAYGEDSLKSYDKRKKLIEIAKDSVDFNCFYNEELLEMIIKSGCCPDNKLCNEEDCKVCWENYLDKI